MKQTTLDLNGPIITVTKHPDSTAVYSGGSTYFVVKASATFPSQSPGTNTGRLVYSWYSNGVKLNDGEYLGTIISGSNTNTLRVRNVDTESIISFDVVGAVEYSQSAYSQPTGSEVTIRTARYTGKSNNEIVFSDPATLTVYPEIIISEQPQSTTVSLNDPATFSVSVLLSDQLTYQWQLDKVNLSDSNTISGSRTPTLTISRDIVGVSSVRVLISHETVDTTTSNEVSLTVVEPRSIINIEGYNSTSTAFLLENNLEDSDFSITSDTIDSDTICLYASEKNTDVEIDLYGAKGSDNGSFSGGEGGYSRIQFTMNKNEEYILKGIKSNTALFLYRKGALIGVVGQGGSAGNGGNGGKGGGVNLAGQEGLGVNAGSGGQRVEIGGLLENGIYGSASNIQASSIYPEDQKATGTTGGKSIKCTKGVYWRNQGLSPCQDIGTSKFRLSDGTEVTNSASITRGFKSGYAINRTAGVNSISSGVGGDGATGGNGGGGQGGGGGGSGYSDGSFTIISTQLGGSTGNARVNVRLSDGGFYIDSFGRILILSCATDLKSPNTLQKITGKVFPGTDTCIDDARWQNFLNLATNTSSGNYRLAVTLDNSPIAVTKATENNLYKLKVSNRLTLRTSLTDWLLWDDNIPENANFPDDLFLSWDEDAQYTGQGADYSGLYWWSPGSGPEGFGYYAWSNNSPFATTVLNNKTANWWILPPGVPDFS